MRFKPAAIKANFNILLGHFWLLPPTVFAIFYIVIISLLAYLLCKIHPAKREEWRAGAKEKIDMLREFLIKRGDWVSGCLWFILFLWLILRN